VADARSRRRGGGDPLPVVLVGAGAMGRNWARTLQASPHTRLVGVVDLNLPLARRVATEGALEGVAVGDSLESVAGESGAAAVVNVTVPAAHRAVNESALRLGLDVLSEKPIAESLADALQQVAVAEVTGRLLMVSQSRRYFHHLKHFRALLGELGPLGTITTEFFHASHEPGFREEMEHPLLVDMSIHHFDALRYLTGVDPVSVRCSAWNPPWSWFAGFASATAEFVLPSGARYVYSGSRCCSGRPTSWNGSWHVYAEAGAAAWTGDDAPTSDSRDVVPPTVAGGEQIDAALAEFVMCREQRRTPQNEIHSNLMSLAMVEGAVVSARIEAKVVLADLLEESYRRAVAGERRDDVRAQLESWGSAAGVTERPAWPSGSRR
jgi:myo-inositol 2-dehydrogenase / D-chiro-inositol 1-dehydrogenase